MPQNISGQPSDFRSYFQMASNGNIHENNWQYLLNVGIWIKCIAATYQLIGWFQPTYRLNNASGYDSNCHESHKSMSGSNNNITTCNPISTMYNLLLFDQFTYYPAQVLLDVFENDGTLKGFEWIGQDSAFSGLWSIRDPWACITTPMAIQSDILWLSVICGGSAVSAE